MRSTAQTIAQRLEEAAKAYYDGTPSISDAEFDKLKAQLKGLDANHPFLRQIGSAPGRTPLSKVQHGIVMGSLNNAMEDDAADFDRWFAKCREAGAKWFVVQPKLDGLSIELVYLKGKLKRAITRGDGSVGEDVTHTVSNAHGVPATLTGDDIPDRLYVRGECVVKHTDFRKHFTDNANPRNAAAGTVRRLDGSRSEHLTFIAFDILAEPGVLTFDVEQEKVVMLSGLGFDAAETSKVSADAVLAKAKEIGKTRALYPYDMDGAVIKVNRCKVQDKMGHDGVCPRWAVAYKWSQKPVEATVVGLEMGVGHTGAITPVAVLDPVECLGVTVRKASLANWDEVDRLQVGLGAKVGLIRAGEVIPKVVNVITPGSTGVFKRPTNCPVCNAKTHADGPRQLCVSPNCPAKQFRKVVLWTRKRDIKWLGEEIVDRLMAVGGPVRNAADLYTISLKQITTACGSAKTAVKIKAEIDRSRDVTLAEFVGSIGIEGFSTTDAEKLLDALNCATVVDVLGISEAEIRGVEGFGALKAASIVAGIADNNALLIKLGGVLSIRAPVAAATDGTLKGMSFCVTGATDIPRDKLIEIIKKSGGIWKSGVSSTLNYLVMADPNSNSTKAKKARACGTKCISETDLLDMAKWDGAL